MNSNAPARPWKEAIRDSGDRLHRDYAARVAMHALSLDTWGSSTRAGVAIAQVGRRKLTSRIHVERWEHHVRYAKKLGPLGLFGQRRVILEFSAVEQELRQAIDAWLDAREAHRH